MSKGQNIIVISPPRGVRLEGLIDDTSYPGTAMQMRLATNFVNGRPRWQYYQPSADGDPRLCAILLEDYTQGGLMTLAHTSGTDGYLYAPLPGEDINICVAAQQGTGSANAYTIGERLIPQRTNGQFILESTSNFLAWFMSMEHIDITADAVGWVWAMKLY